MQKIAAALLADLVRMAEGLARVTNVRHPGRTEQ
jgi:hypothetical protein